MECYYHSGITANGTCVKCGRALCHSCLNILTPPICKDCGIAYCKKRISDCYFNLTLMGIAFCLGYFLEISGKPLRLTPTPLGTAILFAVALTGMKIFFKYFFNTFNIFMCIILGLPGLVAMVFILALLIAFGYFILPVMLIWHFWSIAKYKKLLTAIA